MPGISNGSTDTEGSGPHGAASGLGGYGKAFPPDPELVAALMGAGGAGPRGGALGATETPVDRSR